MVDGCPLGHIVLPHSVTVKENAQCLDFQVGIEETHKPSLNVNSIFAVIHCCPGHLPTLPEDLGISSTVFLSTPGLLQT